MNLEHYSGRILQLAYPPFLKVAQRDPEWFAASADGKTTVAIAVDPEPAAADGFTSEIRNPCFAKSGGVTVDRQGYLKVKGGLEGYERVARLIDAIGRVYTYSWLIDGKFQSRVLNIQITTVERDWQNGSIWESLVKSIRVVDR